MRMHWNDARGEIALNLTSSHDIFGLKAQHDETLIRGNRASELCIFVRVRVAAVARTPVPQLNYDGNDWDVYWVKVIVLKDAYHRPVAGS